MLLHRLVLLPRICLLRDKSRGHSNEGAQGKSAARESFPVETDARAQPEAAPDATFTGATYCSAAGYEWVNPLHAGAKVAGVAPRTRWASRYIFWVAWVSERRFAPMIIG